MTYPEVTLLFVVFPLAANFLLAAAAIGFPAAFEGDVVHCWAAVAIRMLTALWTFVAFLVAVFGARHTLIALLGHGIALIVLFAVYKGYGLAQRGSYAPLRGDGSQPADTRKARSVPQKTGPCKRKTGPCNRKDRCDSGCFKHLTAPSARARRRGRSGR